jgi:hypothetical protein
MTYFFIVGFSQIQVFALHTRKCTAIGKDSQKKERHGIG